MRLSTSLSSKRKRVHTLQMIQKKRKQQHSYLDGEDHQDALCLILGFLSPPELLTVALVSKPWQQVVNQTAERHLVETERNHGVSQDWRQRLAKPFPCCRSPPSRLLWNAAQKLYLNRFDGIPWGTTFPRPGSSQFCGSTRIATRRPDGHLQTLDTRTGKWTCWDAVTGAALDGSNATSTSTLIDSYFGWDTEEEQVPEPEARGSLHIHGNYVVLYHHFPPDFHSFSVWRYNSNNELVFLHYTTLGVPLDPNGDGHYDLQVALQDGALVIEYVEEMMDLVEDKFNLSCIPTKDKYLRDEHRLEDSVQQRFGLHKGLYEFQKIHHREAYDLETGKAYESVDYKPFCEWRVYHDDTMARPSILTSENKHWIQCPADNAYFIRNDHDRDDQSIRIHEIDKKTRAGHPHVPRVVLVERDSLGDWLEGIYKGKDELICCLQSENSKTVQTFLL